MLGLMFMLQAVAAQEAPATVDSVTIAPQKQATRQLPPWSDKIKPQGWPFMGGGEDRAILVFAKTATNPPGSPYQQVWVRHEYRVEQTDVADNVALAPYRSERLVEEVDCSKQMFRTLKAYRHSDNNLEGKVQVLGFTEAAWTAPEPGAFDATIVRDACFEP